MRALMILAAGAALTSLALAGPTAAAQKTCKAGFTATGLCRDAVMLNPQPEPPGVYAGLRLRADELNPQPLPPGPPDHNGRRLHPGEAVGFNPQPDPPGVQGRFACKTGFKAGRCASSVMLNPQPEPPGRR